MTAPTPEEQQETLARAFAKGLKYYESEREEEEAKRRAAAGNQDGNDGGSGDSAGRKTLAERLLGL